MIQKLEVMPQAIVIFFGASSGVVLGNVMVRTPSVIAALISSGCNSIL